MGRKFGSKAGWALLNAVADGIEIFQYATYQPSALLRYGLVDLKILEAERARRRMRQAVYRLKRQGLIEERRVERQRAFRLTSLGECLLKQAKERLPSLLPEGLQTIVSFDIPEREKSTRQAFRLYLRRLGFQRIHLSVWASELDWSEQLARQLIEYKIEDWVVVMQGRVIQTRALDPPTFSL